MLRSNISNPEKSDFNYVKDPEHINKMWEIIDKNITIYFEKIVAGYDELESLKANALFNVKSSLPDIRKRLSEVFEGGLYYYQKEENKYKNFFSEESMHEFEDEDDPKAFKSALSTKVPVILKARNSKREMMRDWQTKFAMSKATEVYSIFFNLIDFMNDFTDQTSAVEFSKFDDVTDLEVLFTLNEDDDYNVPGVIGMGIKSSVLFYLNSEYFLGANKNTLYGFYFLSEHNHLGLPSATNEFIMINDSKKGNSKQSNGNFLIDQNYWYPYDLFILYGLRTYRKLKELCSKYKYTLDDSQRFNYVNTFMSEIWDIEYDKILTMTGGDQADAT